MNSRGTPFGAYVLFERLAVGGMAEVFIAAYRDDPEGERVVVKCVLPQLQSQPEIVQMFLDEVRLSSLLNHRNIVRLIDYGNVDDTDFIAMEYVEGISLYRLQRDRGSRQLPLALGCWLMAEACAALAYANQLQLTYSGQALGIVHRDISPPNILLSRSGEVKVADFGVAKATMRLTRSTPGQVKGKWAYMSPEQAENSTVDHRSDIFSLGLVLYELTTGRRVFRGKGAQEIFHDIAHEVYTPPQELIPSYPAALAAIVNKALNWAPGRRYQDAAALREDLLMLIPDEPMDRLLSSMVQDAMRKEEAGEVHVSEPDESSMDSLKTLPSTGPSFDLGDDGVREDEEEDTVSFPLGVIPPPKKR